MNRFLFLSLLALCVAACTPKRTLFGGDAFVYSSDGDDIRFLGNGGSGRDCHSYF